MPLSTIYLWQKAPALRLLAPFIVGTLVQWYAHPAVFVSYSLLALSLFSLSFFWLLPLALRYKASSLQGAALSLLVATMAMLLVQRNDVRNHAHYFNKNSIPADAVLLTLQEPLVEKPASFKALAKVEAVRSNESIVPAAGKVLVYFKKDAVAGLRYGSQVWVFEKVSPIRNSGNPAGFNYERYSLFAGITHQVYLTTTDFLCVPGSNTTAYKRFLFLLQQHIVGVLKKYISSPRESGLAEALLIGYKDDLDKTLVQSYSNTGVVHIIAISGLHVGLIYGLLLLLTRPLCNKKLKWLRVTLILMALWSFGLLAGAQPSVMRSVVMFSAIAVGTVLDRNTNIYNNLALSALCLLCYNPFWLWDVGFQLSYIAVLSIVIFYGPIYNWLYLQNKALDALWKLLAVTLAAQVLTTPLTLYYFHQFPVLFLITNAVAVPLSSLALYGEILICLFAFLPPVAAGVGWVTTALLRMMNYFIERVETVSFSAWPNLSVSAMQALLLFFFITGISVWLMRKTRAGLWFALSCLLCFVLLRTLSFAHAAGQQKLIVYNIAKQQAIDIFDGRTAFFMGDEALVQNTPNKRLHLQPARTAHRITNVIFSNYKTFAVGAKTILIVDTTLAFQTFSKPHVDVLILSKNPNVYIRDLAAHVDIAQIVIDASVPAWKARLWQRDCVQLHLPCYNVVQKGAFVMPVPRPTFAAL